MAAAPSVAAPLWGVMTKPRLLNIIILQTTTKNLTDDPGETNNDDEY